jgi:hypothetical protein
MAIIVTIILCIQKQTMKLVLPVASGDLNRAACDIYKAVIQRKPGGLGGGAPQLARRRRDFFTVLIYKISIFLH